MRTSGWMWVVLCMISCHDLGMKLKLFILLATINFLLAPKLNIYSADTPLVSYTSRIQTLGMDLEEGQFLNLEDRGRVLSSLPEDKRQELVKALFICGPKMDNLNLEFKQCENPVYLVQDKFSDSLFLVLLGQNEIRLKLDNFKIPEDKKEDFERRGFIASEAENLFDAIPNGTVKSVMMEYPRDIMKVDTAVSVTYENIRNIMSMEQIIPSLPKIPLDENMTELISLFYLNTSREILINFQTAFNSVFPGAINLNVLRIFPINQPGCVRIDP